MRFILCVDLEGVASVVGRPGLGLTRDNCQKEYDLARREAIRAINASVRALFEGGAERVVVWDNHGPGVNLDTSLIDERCEILRGAMAERFEDADDFDGALLIGYHAMAGTPRGVLNHSFDSSRVQSIRINGNEVGEMAVDAHHAGLKGVPVIFVLSDRAGVEEARKLLPWARAVVTKEGYGRNVALTYHPLKVERETYEQVLDAVKHLDEMGLFWFELPMTIEIRYMRMEDAHARCGADGEMVDEYTVRRYTDTFSL